MKKFILAAVAATMVASPAMATAAQAQAYGHDRRAPVQKVIKKEVRRDGRTFVQKQVYRPAPVQYRSDWKRGQRFDGRYARNYRQIDYRTHRNLKAPPRGYHYVQSGNDAVLVGITSGIIAAVFANILR